MCVCVCRQNNVKIFILSDQNDQHHQQLWEQMKLFDIPDVISLLSASAFKLLVGAIRCGKRGEPLTRSRNVGC